MEEGIPIITNKAFDPFFDSERRYAVLLGGAGSGKSIAAVQKLLLRITCEKPHRILCVRKVATTLRNSIYQNLVDMISFYGLSHEFNINKSEMRFTHENKNEFILVGMDDSEKIKSIAGITSVWCEEATELEEGDFNQLELRVRGETAHYKQFILTFNPIDEEHWLKARFFDREDDDVYSLKTTFLNNAFLDEPYKKHLMERVKIRENLYKIYVLGEWGRATYGGEFYKCFLFSKHVGAVQYQEELPLHITIDFNVNPYMTCLVWQIKGKHAMQIDEILLRHPRNTSLAICAEFKRLYPVHNSGLFIYGDPGGLKQNTADATLVRVKEKDYSEFTKIKNELEKYRPQLRVPRAYPSVRSRGDFINTILESEYEGISIIIGDHCKKTQADYSYGKEASDGTKHKEEYKDEITEVKCQKYHHITDANDYFLTSAFSSEFYKYQNGDKPGMYVGGDNITPGGW